MRTGNLRRAVIGEEDLGGLAVEDLEHMGERPEVGLGVADVGGVVSPTDPADLTCRYLGKQWLRKRCGILSTRAETMTLFDRCGVVRADMADDAVQVEQDCADHRL